MLTCGGGGVRKADWASEGISNELRGPLNPKAIFCAHYDGTYEQRVWIYGEGKQSPSLQHRGKCF